MRQKLMFAVPVLAVVAGAFWWTSAGNSQNQPAGVLFPYKDKNIVAKGKALYQANCAACHGDNLEGQADWRKPNQAGRMPAPPHDETGHTWHHRDELLFAITKYGIARLTNNPDYQTDMPIYEEVLSDEEIIAVLSFIKSRWPDEIQKRHDMMNAKH